MNIACALRWGVASVGITLLGMTHPIQENISDGEIHRWTALIRGCKGEESQLMAFTTPLVKFRSKLVLTCTFE